MSKPETTKEPNVGTLPDYSDHISDDPKLTRELAAVASIVDILLPFDAEERRRISNYVQGFIYRKQKTDNVIQIMEPTDET